MDNKNIEENYLEKLKKIQASMPKIILPTMGLIDNNTKIEINGSDYIKDLGRSK